MPRNCLARTWMKIAQTKSAASRVLVALFLALALMGTTLLQGSIIASAHSNHGNHLNPFVPGGGVGASTVSSSRLGSGTGGHGMGLVPDPQVRAVQPVALSGTLPTTVDLSQYNPPVEDQGNIGSCSAWATANLRAWYANRDGYGSPAGIYNPVFNPMYTYAQISKGSDKGSTLAQNLTIQQTQGIDAALDYFPSYIDFTDQPNDAQRTNAARFKIAGYTEVSNGYIGNSNSLLANSYATAFRNWIMETLADNTPIVIAFPVYPEFLNASGTHWVVGTPHWWETSPGNHAVFAYGYESAGLLIENQWGNDWGKNGYAVLNWDFVMHYAFEAASIVPLYPPSTWQGLPSGMTDISVGANGSVWAIGSTPVYDGYPIYHWNPSTWTWDQVEGAAARIAVDPTGNPWVVNSFGLIYRRTGDTWTLVPGAARDIGIGANGSVWIVGPRIAGNYCLGGPCDGNIYYYTGAGWQQVPGGANRIAVDGLGNPWIVSGPTGAISKWTGNGWVQVPGSAWDIGIGGTTVNSDGYVVGADQPWIVGRNFTAYQWNGSGWNAMSESAASITVATGGNAWIVDRYGNVYEYFGKEPF